MIKRVGISVFKNGVRSLLLGIILLIISSLVLTSLSIKSATTESMVLARKNLEPEVSVSQNIDKIFENLVEQGLDYSEIKNNWNEYVVPFGSVMAYGLAESDYVLDYNFFIEVTGRADGFNALDENAEIDLESIHDINIVGTNNAELLGEFISSYEIVSGTTFTGKDKEVVVISKLLAEANDIVVGNSININEVVDLEVTDRSFELEVIGIFQSNAAYMNFGVNNTMYVPINDVIDLKGYLIEDNFDIARNTYYINDPVNTDAFIENSKLEYEVFEDEIFLLNDNNDSYEAMVEPLSKLEQFIDLILLIIVIAAVAVISLIVGNSLKDRKYEIGVLLSLGEKKIKIALQYVFEMLFIGVIAFTLSIGISIVVAKDIGEELLGNQIEFSTADEKEVDVGSKSGKGAGKLAKGGGKEQILVVDEIDVSLSFRDILLMFAIGSGIIVISSVIPSLYISRFQPKKILSDRV